MAGYIPRRYSRLKMVTHIGTNWARRGLTSFIRRAPLTTTPRCRLMCHCHCHCVSVILSSLTAAKEIKSGSLKCAPCPESRHVGLTVRFLVKCTTLVVPSRSGIINECLCKRNSEKVVAIGYCLLIQQTLSNSLSWSLVIKYFR